MSASNNLIATGSIKKESSTKFLNEPNSTMRLTSLAVPRDLNLGGTGPMGSKGGTSKKMYAPNLKVVRNKNTNIKTSKDTTTKIRKYDKRKNDSGYSKIANNLIQTCGLFSEGVGTNKVKSNAPVVSSSRQNRKSDEQSLGKPVLTKEKRVDTKNEQNLIKEYLEDDDQDLSEKVISSSNCPVNIGKNSETFIEKNNFSLNRPPILIKSQLFLLQLPDSLPCENNLKTNDDVLEQENIKTNSNIYLTNMEEGQIGKILKFKSGKIKLLLGETQFNLVKGLNSTFLQEVMSINVNQQQRSGTMINLGPIEEKINVIPDWDILLNSCT